MVIVFFQGDVSLEDGRGGGGLCVIVYLSFLVWSSVVCLLYVLFLFDMNDVFAFRPRVPRLALQQDIDSLLTLRLYLLDMIRY